jgi:hypothetical protein
MMTSDQHSSSQIRLVLALGIAQTLGWGSTFYLTAILGPLIGRLIDVHGGRRMLTLLPGLLASIVLWRIKPQPAA